MRGNRNCFAYNFAQSRDLNIGCNLGGRSTLSTPLSNVIARFRLNSRLRRLDEIRGETSKSKRSRKLEKERVAGNDDILFSFKRVTVERWVLLTRFELVQRARRR